MYNTYISINSMSIISSNSKLISIVHKYCFLYCGKHGKIKNDSLSDTCKSNFPTPGVEPGPAG